MDPNGILIKHWRILLIIFIMLTFSIQELPEFLNYDLSMVTINNETYMFLECAAGVLISSLFLYVFIYYVEKNYHE